MQRFVIAALALVAGGAWWLVSGPEERIHHPPRAAGAAAPSEVAGDLYAPRGVASGAGAIGGDAGSPDAPAPYAGSAATSSRTGSTGSAEAGERRGGAGLEEERLRGGSGGTGSSRPLPAPEPPLETDPLAEAEDEDAAGEDEIDPEEVAENEAKAAEVAEQMRLVDDSTLARRVERAMRSDPTLSAEAARNRVLADALIRLYLLGEMFPQLPVEELLKMPMPGDPMPSLRPDERDRKLVEATERFPAA